MSTLPVTSKALSTETNTTIQDDQDSQDDQDYQDEEQSLPQLPPPKDPIAPRWCFLQTLRTQCYTFHMELFRRKDLIKDYMVEIDERKAWCAELGLKVPPGYQVNSMQQLFVDIMQLLDISDCFLALQLAPGYEQWYELYTINTLVTDYVGYEDWKEPCAEFTDMEEWGRLAFEVYKEAREALSKITVLVFIIEHLAKYEGVELRLGSVWPPECVV
ncbi:hypothetical protein B9Z19DRAFT_1145292 [Tuber borchii]|uniref:Uncharacterized protein n=1 Tax=Tuber borchii TaxID=42251 RepID=A0A2T6ZQ79_TUBBO|nr:hypothetical protein B9Z19DRAFT_1145292 [Tuber borchii]